MPSKTKILKFAILALFLANLFFAYNTPGAYARTDDTATSTQRYRGVDEQIKAFLCTPTDSNTNPEAAKGDLYNCINKIYRFALIIVSVMGVFMITIGGWIYMAASGNEESVTKAKNILETTIVALVVIFSGYVLLKFLNPDLIKFQRIQPASVVGQKRSFGWDKVSTGQVQAIFEGTGGVDKAKIGRYGIEGCGGKQDGSPCDDYTDEDYGFVGNGMQVKGRNTFLTKTLLAKLVKLKAKYPSFTINEGYPPTGDHSGKCHNDGSCADIGVNTKTAVEVNKFCKAIDDSGSGLTYNNEYTLQNSNINPAQTPNCRPPNPTSKTTGGHLHVQ